MKLRIHFITEDDPLYVIQFFETFFSDYPRDRFEVIGITIQEAFNESALATARRVLSLYGPLGFARLLPRVVGRKLQGRSLKALARREGIPNLPTESVNDELFIERLRQSAPDVIVSVAAPEIFRNELLGVARLGCINVHSGRLPTYRGMMPTFWQMHAGEPCALVTVHEMAQMVDAGRVLGTAECEIREHDSLERVITETKREGAWLTIKVLGELAAGTSVPQPVDLAAASYFSFPKRRDAKFLERRGHRLL